MLGPNSATEFLTLTIGHLLADDSDVLEGNPEHPLIAGFLIHLTEMSLPQLALLTLEALMPSPNLAMILPIPATRFLRPEYVAVLEGDSMPAVIALAPLAEEKPLRWTAVPTFQTSKLDSPALPLVVKLSFEKHHCAMMVTIQQSAGSTMSRYHPPDSPDQILAHEDAGKYYQSPTRPAVQNRAFVRRSFFATQILLCRVRPIYTVKAWVQR